MSFAGLTNVAVVCCAFWKELDMLHVIAGYIEHDHETGQKKMVVYLRDKGPNDTWPGLGDLQWLGMS